MWMNEDRWDAQIRTASANYGVPVALIKAIIGQESEYHPDAYNPEEKINDASRGLMQILYGTAQSVGYTGPPGDRRLLTGLFDPATNITYGTAYLAKQLFRAGSIPGAISAYNGGWNPNVGFGRQVTRSGVTVCLNRNELGQCIQSRVVPIGEYANQPYVNKVLRNLAYFEARERAPIIAGAATMPPPLDPGDQSDESQADRRVSGSVARTVGTQIWEALVWLLNLFKRRRNN